MTATATIPQRFVGLTMVMLWVAGVMTPLFALRAGGIDVIVGLSAVPVAYLLAPARRLPRWRLRAWHALGLLDFVVAVPLALLASPSPMRLIPGETSTAPMITFPLSFIPAVGVPLAIILHVTALLQLREGRRPRMRSIVHA